MKMQGLMIFRFLAHSLTTFGHETAASGGILSWKSYPHIQGISGKRSCERNKRKAAELPFFHRLRPPDKYHKIGHSNQQAAKPGRT